LLMLRSFLNRCGFRLLAWVLVPIGLIGAIGIEAAASPSFEWIGLPILGPVESENQFTNSTLLGISGDGSTAYGTTYVAGPGGVAWSIPVDGSRPASEMPAAGSDIPIAIDASRDGRFIVANQGSFQDSNPLLWGPEGVEYFASAESDASLRPFARGISDDGSIVVGRIYGGTRQAFRWSSERGMELLPAQQSAVPAGYSEAVDISSDGSFVLGHAEMFVGDDRGETAYVRGAVRWDDEGVHPLFSGIPYALSADDSKAVGELDDLSGSPVAMLWNMETLEATHLADPLRALRTRSARDVSADGSVVVGWGVDADDEQRGFVWTETQGAQEISLFAANLGLPINDGILTMANGISEDGQVITGYGYRPSGSLQGWILVVPEPNTLLLLMLGLFLAARTRVA